MSEQETGETLEAAAQETGDIAEAAAQQEESGVTESLAAGEKTVPLAALEAERKKRQEVEESSRLEVENLRSQFQILQNAQVQQQSPQVQSIFEQMGLEKDDMVTVEHVEKAWAAMEQRSIAKNAAQQYVTAAKTFIDRTPDYAEKVGSMNAYNQFVPSPIFQAAMAADPELRKDYFAGNLMPAQAHRAVKGFEAGNELAKLKATAKEQETIHSVNLKTRPGSPAAVGGGGGGLNASINAGLDINSAADRVKVRTNFQRALEGDYDP